MKANPKAKRHVRKIIGWSAIALAALITVLLVILLLVDVAIYRGPLQSGVSALVGRSVTFEGEMSLRPSLRPKIVVEDVHITNPAWASRPDFARAERFELQVALLPLIAGDLEILNLALEGGDILFETRPDGRNNWTFKRKRHDLPEIASLTLRRSVVEFRSSAERVHRLTISKAEGVLNEGERIQIEAAGTYQDAPFTLSLLGGTPSEFVTSDKPWPIKLMTQATGATIEVEGIITQPFKGKGFDLQVAVAGNELADLSSLLDTTLPALGSYALSGHVSEADDRYRITDLTGHLDGADAVKRLTLTKGTVSASLDAPSELRLEGTYADVPFMAAFAGGSLAELTAPNKPWPVEVMARLAGTTVNAEGTVSRPLAGEGFDLRVTVEGTQLSGLDPLLNAELPALGHYAVSGRFVNADDNYSLSELEIKVGRHHVTGNLEMVTSGPRPHIAANLSADKIYLEDLTKALNKRKDQAPAKQDDERVIPDVTIPVKALRSVDLELNLNVTDVLAGPTGLGNVVLKAKLENGRLLISPFKAKLSGGQLSVKLDVDAAKDMPVMKFQLTGEHIDYGALLKVLEVTDAIESVLDADVDVTGRGNTLRSVLANANGSAVLVSGPGSIDHDKLDLWGADLLVGIMMLPMVALKTKKVMELNCIVWPLDVTNGVARSESILIDMPKVTVGGNGTINLSTEELELLLKPARKKASLFSLDLPVRVTGTLSKLNEKVEGKAETFGKAVLPVFNPAFLLVTAKAGTGEMNPCVAAISGEEP